MKYYVYYRKKNQLKETGYIWNASNLIRIKLVGMWGCKYEKIF